MIEQPKATETVLIDEHPDHSLPLAFKGIDLPVKGAIVERASASDADAYGDLWWVLPSPPWIHGKVQVHREQLFPYPTRTKADKIAAQFWTTERMLFALFNHTAGKEGGVLGINHNPDEADYHVMCEYGREMDEGEPTGMVGAATYGVAMTLRGALMRAGADAGLWTFDDSPEPTERQERVLIVEADHPAEMNVNAVQGSMSLLADADRAYVFSGDKGAVLKDRDRDIDGDPFSIAVAVQRRPVRTELGPDLTLIDSGRTLGAHIGIPVAHARALLTAIDLDAVVEHGKPGDREKVEATVAELTRFVAEEGEP